MDSSEKENFVKSVHRLWNLIGDPPTHITDQRSRLHYRFISIFTIAAFPILIFAQIVSNEGIFGTQIFSIPAFLIFASSILGRKGHLNLAIAINLLSFSLYPYIFLIVKETWSLEYSLLILIWIPVTMLIGSYLLDQRDTALFIGTHDVVFLIVVLAHPGASVFMSAFLESVIPLFAISTLIFVGSWTRQRHINQLEKLIYKYAYSILRLLLNY